MYLFFKLLIFILIIGLFLLSKLLPYQTKLQGNFKSTFNLFEGILSPILDGLKKVIKPFKVGEGLFVDMSQIVLLVILLLLLLTL
jgi:hypothetical protein